MPKKNFLLLSLEDAQIKRISNVISNDSCRKILDYLSNRDATESELASKLGIPISTVHYNLQQLVEAGLVSADEYHYSEKGKEVNHYRLANKYIIIAPKKAFGIKEKLKSILPVVLIISGTALVLQFVSKYLYKPMIPKVETMAAKSALIESASLAQDAAQAQSAMPEPNIAVWFFIGALFAILVYLLISALRKDIR